MFTSLRIRDSFIRLNRILKKEERSIIVYFDLNNEILRLTIAFKKYNLNKRLENEEKLKETFLDNDSIDIIITKLKIQGVILEAVIENFKEFKDYVKKELFKGNFVMSRRRFLRGVGETAVLSALSGSFVHSSLNLIAAYYLLLSHKLPRRNDNALAILISKDFPLSLAGELILMGDISRIELAFGV